MIVDIECPRCRGEGWLLQRAPRLGPGLYEVTCEHCNIIPEKRFPLGVDWTGKLWLKSRIKDFATRPEKSALVLCL